MIAYDFGIKVHNGGKSSSGGSKTGEKKFQKI